MVLVGLFYERVVPDIKNRTLIIGYLLCVCTGAKLENWETDDSVRAKNDN